MAAYSASESVHDKTLSGTTADTITLTTTGPTGSEKFVTVSNWDVVQKLYVRLDGQPAVASADDTFVVGPGEWRKFDRRMLTTISVVGNGNIYSVEGEDS